MKAVFLFLVSFSHRMYIFFSGNKTQSKLTANPQTSVHMHIHYIFIQCVYSQKDCENAMKKSKAYKGWRGVFPLSQRAGVEAQNLCIGQGVRGHMSD